VMGAAICHGWRRERESTRRYVSELSLIFVSKG